MKKLLTVLMLVTLLACGKESGGGKGDVADVGQPTQDNYVPVAQAQITITNDPQISRFYKTLNFFNPIQMAYAATSNATVTYVYSAIGSIAIAAPTTVGASTNDQPNFGPINVTSFDSNDLRLCTGGTRCPYARIRAYVSSRSGTFVDYGAKVKIGSNTLSDSNGVAGAVNLVTGTITTNRIRSSNANQNPFLPGPPSLSSLGDLVLDLSDANAGSYSVTITIELAVGE